MLDSIIPGIISISSLCRDVMNALRTAWKNWQAQRKRDRYFITWGEKRITGIKRIGKLSIDRDTIETTTYGSRVRSFVPNYIFGFYPVRYLISYIPKVHTYLSPPPARVVSTAAIYEIFLATPPAPRARGVHSGGMFNFIKVYDASMKKLLLLLLILCAVLSFTAPVSAGYFFFKDVSADDFVNALVAYSNHNEVRNMTNYDFDLSGHGFKSFNVTRTKTTLDFDYECKGAYVMFPIIPVPCAYYFVGHMHVDNPDKGLDARYSVSVYDSDQQFTARGSNWALTGDGTDIHTRFYENEEEEANRVPLDTFEDAREIVDTLLINRYSLANYTTEELRIKDHRVSLTAKNNNHKIAADIFACDWKAMDTGYTVSIDDDKRGFRATGEDWVICVRNIWNTKFTTAVV